MRLLRKTVEPQSYICLGLLMSDAIFLFCEKQKASLENIFIGSSSKGCFLFLIQFALCIFKAQNTQQ